MPELVHAEDREHADAVPHAVDDERRQRWEPGGVGVEPGDESGVQFGADQRRGDEGQREEDDVSCDRRRPN